MRIYVDTTKNSSKKRDPTIGDAIMGAVFFGLFWVWVYYGTLSLILVILFLALIVLISIVLISLSDSNTSPNLSLNMAEIDQMSGYEFEEYIATLYNSLGYSVQQTALSGDQGADLVLAKNGERIAVQTKRYTNKVSNKAIQEVVASKALYGCNRCIVVTNNYFTKPATELADVNDVELVDRTQLKNLIYNVTNQFYVSSTANEQDSAFQQKNFNNYLDSKNKQTDYLEYLDEDDDNPPLPFYMKQSIQAENNKKEIHSNKEQKSISQSKVESDFENTIGIEFMHILDGEFQMGSSEKDSEKPIHKATILKPFYLSKFPVTQKQWITVMGTNPSRFKDNTDRPVEMVSWYDVQQFIAKLNSIENTNKYRLPSEAEWEYACKADTTTRYSFGNNKLKLDDYAWYSNNSEGETHPVGKKKPNSWGLHDMHGNVWEWCQDEWHDSYENAPSDGSCWLSTSKYNNSIFNLFSSNNKNVDHSTARIKRGGSWNYNDKECRSASRSSTLPENSGFSISFRLVRET
nr:SUMF1/EgtB/PvdO family nonheme iron enzyme [uncultured Methanolobus sp.]